jgi:hypothetical protein
VDYRTCAADGCLGRISLDTKAQYCTPACRPSHKADLKRRKAAGLQGSRYLQHGLKDAAYLAFKARGKCDACGTTDPGHPRGFMVDHDHLCCPRDHGCEKCIRGLLCHGCNMALGAIKDDADRILDLYAYLYRDQGMPASKAQEALNG